MKLFTFALIGLVGPTLSVTLGQSSAATHAAALDENRGAANVTYLEETGFPSPPAITQSVRRVVRHLGRSIGVSINARRAKRLGNPCMCREVKGVTDCMNDENSLKTPDANLKHFTEERANGKTTDSISYCCERKEQSFVDNFNWSRLEKKDHCSPDVKTEGVTHACCKLELTQKRSFTFSAKVFIKKEESTYVPIRRIGDSQKQVVNTENQPFTEYFFKSFIQFLVDKQYLEAQQGAPADTVLCSELTMERQGCQKKLKVPDRFWDKYVAYYAEKKKEHLAAIKGKNT